MLDRRRCYSSVSVERLTQSINPTGADIPEDYAECAKAEHWQATLTPVVRCRQFAPYFSCHDVWQSAIVRCGESRRKLVVKITSMKVRISITKPMAGLRYSESVINPPLKAWVVNVAQSAEVVHLR